VTNGQLPPPSLRRAIPRLALLAVTTYAVAWFVPVIEHGTTLAEGGLPGFQALLVSLSPLFERPAEGRMIVAMLAVASGLGNAVFVTGAIVAARPRAPRRLALLVALAITALVNSVWLFEGGFDDLRAGYYLWLSSYPMLFVALVRGARAPAD
jgi:hypothetical protein